MREVGVESGVTNSEQNGSINCSDDVESGSIQSASLAGLIQAHRSGDSRKYRDAWRIYEDRRGLIRESYFGDKLNGGVVIFEEPRTRFFVGRFGRFLARIRSFTELRIDLTYSIERVDHRIDEILRKIRTAEREAAVLLRGRAHHLVVQNSYWLIVYLLKVIESSHYSRDDDVGAMKVRTNAAVISANKELRAIDEYAKKAARRASLGLYLTGLPLGAALGIWMVVSVAESKTVLPVLVSPDDKPIIAVSLACGAIGAVISVMARINSSKGIEVESDRGRIITFLAGGFRPIIGAVFGAFLYVLIFAGLLPFKVQCHVA